MRMIERWREYLGPVDERLAAESGRYVKVGFCMLLIGASLCLYYGIMLQQVAETTGNPLLTPLGASVVPSNNVLLVVILAACFVPLGLEVRAGAFDEHSRIASVDTIPWDYVAVLALICGASLGVVTAGMRILAEIQIVGIAEVTWAGDLAMGAVYFVMAFVLGIIVLAGVFNAAIKRRHALEAELGD
ncbi:hypothetical protein [Adlercreutzia faecimuris]|uniref:DUF2975 domain-containing protein n=1 Tax=Adlercreutzia faecimuris TaxID=2897341 RepID=A0ABS9WIF1_9ACTN|nr:hypothetical protein [Adlercreutzia sp. JBNU-10]MCI2242654.1 hypothetical protein [Adlercreutzia sp. JBNU-10]